MRDISHYFTVQLFDLGIPSIIASSRPNALSGFEIYLPQPPQHPKKRHFLVQLLSLDFSRPPWRKGEAHSTRERESSYFSMGSHYKGNPDYLPPKGDGPYVIKPISLDIIWGRSHWQLPQSENDPAEVQGVNWFEVSGSIELNKLSPGKNKISFTVSLKPNAYGWSDSPVYVMAKIGRNGFNWKGAELSGRDPDVQFHIPDQDHTFELTDADIESNERLNFGLYEIWRGSGKSGLVIHEVVISPL
ncbi:protein PHLOEM PROTEIN 2-LIKE A9-like [Magnolia sinica]|uniref:protein PHLOEM PROTEIN 2-LIKE A9-like n=1 Tax=Magnolia sinica TaxID=86752 RepID=UPI00265A4A04|nr:protein PHLOEM PROTEIN 2-LIKE A9-like [Magnolia sinica]